MAKNLLIVESPAKAKTIEKFLGKDFKVTSCQGHIRDLIKGNGAIDKENNFEPKYQVSPEKQKIVTELKKLAKSAEEIWLATDEDREGEAISWHLCEELKLDPENTKRIVFHEITKEAINNAVKNPRFIDKNLVDAQQARRVLDRLVGFELSPILWKKIRPSLSAGRVQSVAVRLIVEREREVMHFESKSSFKVSAIFDVEGKDGRVAKLKAESNKKFDTEKSAHTFLEECLSANFTISDIQTKPAKKTPAAPFTTSTLQQEASRKLSFSVSRTMTVAQKLYEAGHITYMRTDSVNMSKSAITASANEIEKSFGKEYVNSKNYTTKKSGTQAQEAHEAIRPTYFENHEINASYDEERLYELIWKRTVASQMSEAKLERTTVKIDISTNKQELSAKGEVLLFDGFLKLYIESKDDDEEEEKSDMLPPLSKGQQLELDHMLARERFSKALPRYNEASLVRKLEELGIGRPSTYAPTITTIQKRNYVEKKDMPGEERAYQLLRLKDGQISTNTESEITGAEKQKLFPTDIGMVVNDFLLEHFKNVLDYNFTARIEEDFDVIAHGDLKWNKMISDFYKPFHKTVEKTEEEAERASGERILGTDPKSGRELLVRIGKYGPMAQIGKTDDEEKPRFAKLRNDQKLETITMEEALDLFKLPRQLGEFEDKVVTAAIGRFGPYVRHDSKFVSIPKDMDVYEIKLDEAIGLIKEKREVEAKRLIKDFEGEDIQLLNGRYGPYIKAGKKNVRIPKDKEPEELSLEEIKELIAKAPEKKGRGGRKKKK